jgi:hypothetical protein
MPFTGIPGNALAMPANIVLAYMQTYSLETTFTWYEWFRSNVFLESGRMPTWTAPTMTALIKRASEVRLYTMNLSALPELVGGDTVATISSIVCTAVTQPANLGATTSDLTFSSQSVPGGGQGAQVKISGGVDGAKYTIAFTIVTTAGYTLVGVGYLYVDDK